MTDNTQSLIDRMAEALRAMQLAAIDHHADNSKSPELFRAASKANCIIVEHEAHKASHSEDMLDMVKARQCDAVPVREATVWQYRDIIYGDEALWWEECSKSDYEELSLESNVYETRALGVIDQGAA